MTISAIALVAAKRSSRTSTTSQCRFTMTIRQLSTVVTSNSSCQQQQQSMSFLSRSSSSSSNRHVLPMLSSSSWMGKEQSMMFSSSKLVSIQSLQKHYSNKNDWSNWIPMYIGAITILAMGDVVTRNDAAASTTVVPYRNLPKEDEETECELCKIFRQGPCRAVYRNFEYCAKDHELKTLSNPPTEEEVNTYGSHFASCFSKYEGLYELISLDDERDFYGYFTEAILSLIENKDKVKDDSVTHTSLCWKKDSAMIDINIDGWKAIDFRINDKVLIHKIKNDPSVPLWKRFQDGTNPVTVSGKVRLTKTMPVSGGKSVLTSAWVVDQDNTLLGRAKDSDDESDDKQLEVAFKAVPGITKTVTVVGVYVYDDFEKELFVTSTPYKL